MQESNSEIDFKQKTRRQTYKQTHNVVYRVASRTKEFTHHYMPVNPENINGLKHEIVSGIFKQQTSWQKPITLTLSVTTITRLIYYYVTAN